jgi:quinol-cytochrome oxidoreductase complex cytochrome b subunit
MVENIDSTLFPVSFLHLGKAERKKFPDKEAEKRKKLKNSWAKENIKKNIYKKKIEIPPLFLLVFLYMSFFFFFFFFFFVFVFVFFQRF